MTFSYDAEAKRTGFDLRVTVQIVREAQARIISTQIASRLCWLELPIWLSAILTVCGPRHRRGYLSGRHRPQA
jgi:hypothetical protein